MATKIKGRLTRKEQTRLSETEKLIWFYRQFPVIAAKDLIGVDLVWYQRKMLNDMFFKDYVLLVLGRGVGKTWLDALFVILYVMLYPKTKIGIIAPVFRQAGYLFDFIEEFYEMSPYFRSSVRKYGKNKGIKRTASAEIVKFNNGSFIEALPLGDGSKVRGRRYHIIVADEYAQLNEDIIKLVVRPMMNVRKQGIKNKFISSSSAFYAWNHLYIMFLLYKVMEQREPESYAVHEYNYEDVLRTPNSPYQIDMNVIRMQKADMTVEAFEMENLGKFPIESKGFFPARLIESCVAKRDGGAEIELTRSDGRYVMGVDAARVAGGDNFAISVIRIDGGLNRTLVYVKSMNGAPFQEMRDMIRIVLSRFPIIRITMDPAGGGTTLKDLLSESWTHPSTGQVYSPIFDMNDSHIPEEAMGLRMLEMLNFTQPSVNHLFTSLKSDMQHNRLTFPIDIRKHPDRELEKAGWDLIATKQELMLIEAEPVGNFFRFQVPEGKKKDRAVSLALANYSANQILLEPEIAQPELGIGFWA